MDTISFLTEKEILPQVMKDLEEFNFEIDVHSLNDNECGLSIYNNKNSYWVPLSNLDNNNYKLSIVDNSKSTSNSKLEDNILLFEENISKDMSYKKISKIISLFIITDHITKF